MLGVDERGDATGGLGVGHRMQSHGGLSRTLGAVDLDDPAAREAADAQRDVQGYGSGGDHLDRRGGALTEAHDRALAVLLVDLRQGDVERLVPVEACCHVQDTSS